MVKGRLRSGGRALAGQQIQVWQQLATSGTPWTPVATTSTDSAGRLKYRAPRGPGRRLRLRFPGTPLLRGHNADVALRVPARTTIRPSRKNVVNGEYVTFKGRVKGGHIPPEGTLVELQVFTRKRWRTFAQPRAAADTGRWSFMYRFETISGNVSFRVRARIRRQSNYPFAQGGSKTVRVHVRGL